MQPSNIPNYGAQSAPPTPDTGDSYDPSLVTKAIRELMEKMKAIIASGGHVSEMMTAELMYLIQGFGGEVVGQDGEAQSALTEAQSWVAKAWDLLKNAGDPSQLPDDADKEFEQDMQKARDILQKEVDKGVLSKQEFDNIVDALNKPVSQIMNFKNWWAQHKNDPCYQTPAGKAEAAQIQKFVNNGQILKAMFYIGQAHTFPNVIDPTTKQPAQMQGNPQFVDAMNSAMTSLNQQITGASQVMATQAKADSKTEQSESTAFNNYLLMLKKMNAYLVQLQRTN